MAGVCGKDCMGCTYRQKYGCRGCLETGGNPVWGSCRAAACCHSQGMQNCGECPTREGCGKPAEMDGLCQRWAMEEASRRTAWKEALARRVPVMVRWLPVLFWISLASEVLSLFNQLFEGQAASLVLSAVSLALSIASLVIYWKLSVLSDRLRLVWRLQIISMAAGAVLILLLLPAFFLQELASTLAAVAVVGTLGLSVVGMVVLYQFCEAMAEELEQSDPPGVGEGVPPGFRFGAGSSLAGSWRMLRKCIFWCLGAILAVFVLVLALQGSAGALLLLLVLLLIAALVLAGCGIAQLVMLWKSGRFFRDLPPADPSLPPAEEDAPL